MGLTRSRVRLAIDILAVLALVAGLVGIVVVLGRQDSEDRASAAASHAIQQARTTDPVGYRYLLELQTQMQRVSDHRDDAVKAIAAVENGCAKDPNVAVGIIHTLANARQDLLDSLGQTPLPVNHPHMAAMAVELEHANALALDTDQAYQAWFLKLRVTSFRPGKGCPGGPPREGALWNRVVEAETAVAPARATFVKDWNAFADKYGVFDWSVDHF